MTRVCRVPRLRWTIGLLAAFACCVVAAGHGVAPLGLFLVVGVVEEPMLGIIAWAALLVLPVAQRLNNRALYALGLAGLGTTWGAAYRFVDVRWLLVLTSVPFLFLLAVQLRGVVMGVEEEVASRGNGAPSG